MANIFGRIIDALNKPLPDLLNKPLPGTDKKSDTAAAAEKTKAGDGSAGAPSTTQTEAPDLQTELARREREARRRERLAADTKVRDELRKTREELTKLRREYETKLAEEARAHADTEDTTYTIVAGDTLWGIAQKYYGQGAKWHAIADANKDKIPNPNLIYPGQTIVIPDIDD